MKKIEQGEEFKLSTDQRLQAFKLLLKELRKYGQLDKGIAVKKIYDQGIYEQRQDCKDFIRNSIRSENLQIRSKSERTIEIEGQKSVVFE